jgi:hypothetical protein
MHGGFFVSGGGNMINKFSETLKSPRFWAAILAITFILLKVYAPILKINEVDLTSAVIALVAFIAAASVSSAPSYLDILKSLRFWSLIVSLMFVFIRTFWAACPLSEADVQMLVVALGAGSIGVSYRPIGETL